MFAYASRAEFCTQRFALSMSGCFSQVWKCHNVVSCMRVYVWGTIHLIGCALVSFSVNELKCKRSRWERRLGSCLQRRTIVENMKLALMPIWFWFGQVPPPLPPLPPHFQPLQDIDDEVVGDTGRGQVEVGADSGDELPNNFKVTIVN